LKKEKTGAARADLEEKESLQALQRFFLMHCRKIVEVLSSTLWPADKFV
jgi:hypothetical protein